MASESRAVTAGIGLVVVLAIVVGLLLLWQAHSKQVKLQAAHDQVHRASSCPDEDFLEVVQQKDPWNNDLVLRENDGAFSYLAIISKGPDGIADTTDDVKGYRNAKVDWILAGEHAGEAGGDLSRGALKGLLKSYRKSREPSP